MLQSIISYLQVKLQALNIATVYGLCELVYNTEREITQPAIYDGSGQYMPLDFDNHAGLMYFRKISVSNSFVESVLGDDGIQRTYTLKLVAFVPKSVYNTDNNYIDDKLANNISLIIDNDSDVILGQSLAAENISISTLSYDTNRRNVLLAEGLEGNIPFEYVLLSLDFSVTVVGSQDCFEIYGCDNVPIDYLKLLRDAICLTTCLDATVTATNSDSTVLGQTTAPSGGTGNIPIADSVISNTTGVIDNLPATTPLTIIDSVITLNNTVGTLSTTNVPATTNLTLTAPDSTTNVTDQNGTPLGQVTGISGATNTQSVTVPPCADGTAVLSDQFGNSLGSVVVASGATENETVTLPCSSFGSFTDQFGTANAFSIMATFGTITANARASAVNGNFIYLANFNNIEKLNATTFAPVAVIGGFNNSVEVAFSPDGTQYAVANFTGNTVRIMDTATDTQIASWASVTTPFSICYNNTGTELLVAGFSATTLTIYDLVGNTLGTVSGFDGLVLDIRRAGLNYHVLTATGNTSASTQRVRVMDFATNTQQSTHSLGTVTAIGAVQSLAIEGSTAWITSIRNGGMLIYEYNLTYTLQRSQNLGLLATNSYGLAYNGNSVCPTLIAPLPPLLTSVSIKI
jgi:hypothetical protein